ncbi:MAG: 5-formyltetrahydrofolate cyclo-ligase [Clostridia bacterium]|nr:5-formyltetrahydrofolate cyclo-ligase [Clostridia bacterium]
MTPIKREKDIIRKDCSEKRNAMTPEERMEKDARVCKTIESLVSFRHADIILLYAPIKSEIDILPIFNLAKAKGKRVAFPKCNTEERTMKFHFVDSLDELAPLAYGIREPSENAPVYDPEKTQGVAICLVPGLAFDAYGYRLGYGKGYYDKFMNNFSGSSIGIVYSSLILPNLPRGRYDKHCDVLVTENGIKTIKTEK